MNDGPPVAERAPAGPILRRTGRRWLLPATGGAVLLLSVGYLMSSFTAPDGTQCGRALTTADDSTVRTESEYVELDLPPYIEVFPTVAPGTPVRIATETRTIHTPTACALAAQERFLGPSIALGVTGFALGIYSEVRAWRRRDLEDATPARRRFAELLQVLAGVGWLGVGVWYGSVAALASNATIFGTLAAFVGVVHREWTGAPRSWRELTKRAKEERNPELGARYFFHHIAGAATWMGVGCFVAVAVRLL